MQEGAETDARQLVERLVSPEWSVRDAARGALLSLGEAGLDALAEGLAHPDARARLWCADLMDHLADARCAEPLRRALADPSADVRRHAVHSLGCQRCKPAPLDADVVGLLRERALFDRSIRVRRVSVHQLGLQPHDPRAVEALEAILREETDEKLLSRARFALRRQREQETQAAFTPSRDLRKAAVPRGSAGSG
jgi:HEAT repeat protein